MTDILSKRYYKISEVAELIGVSQSTLRYWEQEFDLVSPTRRPGGNRHYRPADIERLRMIYYLVKEKGLSLKAARDQLHNNPSGISRRIEALQRLRAMRRTLTDILAAIDPVDKRLPR